MLISRGHSFQRLQTCAALLVLILSSGCATKGDLELLEKKAASLADENRKAVVALTSAMDKRLEDLQNRINSEAKKAAEFSSTLGASIQQTRTDLTATTQSASAQGQRLSELRELLDQEISTFRRDLATAQDTLSRVSSESASSALKVSEVAEENRRQIANVSREFTTRINSSVEQMNELRARISRLEESVVDVLSRIRSTIVYQQNAMRDQAATIARSIRDFDDTLSTFDDLFPELEAKNAATGTASLTTGTGPAPGR